MIPLATREAKTAQAAEEKAIFRSYAFGVVTNRDDWVYGDSISGLEAKVRYLIDAYNADLEKIGPHVKPEDIGSLIDTSIKWTRAVKRDLTERIRYQFDPQRIVSAMYRPFVRRFLYFSPQLNEMPNLMPRYFGPAGTLTNRAIVVTDPTSQKPFMTMAIDTVPDMHLVGAAAGGVVIPLTIQDSKGTIENVTDWALRRFRRATRETVGDRLARSPKKISLTMCTECYTIPLTATNTHLT